MTEKADLYFRKSNELEWKPITYEENVMNDNANDAMRYANVKGKLYGKSCDCTVIDELKAMSNYEDYRTYANIIGKYTGTTTSVDGKPTYPWFIQDEELLRKSIKKANKMIKEHAPKLPKRMGIPYWMDHWYYAPDMKKVIFCPPATIVMWADGTKTVVKTNGEEFSEEHGLAMAVAKKYFGSRSEFLKVVKDAKRVDADKKKAEKKAKKEAKKKAKKPKAASKTTKTVKRTTKKTTKTSKEKK